MVDKLKNKNFIIKRVLYFVLFVRSHKKNPLRSHKKNKMDIYFNYLPDELNREILSYISDFDTFKNLYISNEKSIKKMLDDHNFWKYLIESKIGYLMNYITPLINKSTTSNLTDFFYRLSYYTRVVNSYKEVIKIFKEMEDFHESLVKKFFHGKSLGDINKYKNDIDVINMVIKDRILITFSGDSITD